jgi:hypothetical protein
MHKARNSYKKESISLSSTFTIRNRCTKCSGYPEIYFFVRDKMLFKDHKYLNSQFNWSKKYIKRMCSDYYMMLDPKYFTDLRNFSHKPSYKCFSPKLHHSSGKSHASNILEFLMCKCGSTAWKFSEKFNKNSPEIYNRRSLVVYSV